MTEVNTTYQSNSASSGKMLRAMVGIGILCALMIVLTYEGTLPRVTRLKAEALERAIFKVIPGTEKTSAFRYEENNGFSAVGDGEKTGKIIYAGYDKNEQLTGVAIEASGMGYADVIRILYGYDFTRQAVVGFYVLESKETPGLGDKIEKDENFLSNFIALDASLNDDLTNLKNKIIPVKSGAKKNKWEVDCITGATISSRTIGEIIGESTEEWVPVIFKNKEAFNAP
ncbi:MAG: FMN-binding protein [Bacteroidota bacterium]